MPAIKQLDCSATPPRHDSVVPTELTLSLPPSYLDGSLELTDLASGTWLYPCAPAHAAELIARLGHAAQVRCATTPERQITELTVLSQGDRDWHVGEFIGLPPTTWQS